MSRNNDGGPAFPGAALSDTQINNLNVVDGMSLRDWFAGQALVMAGVYLLADGQSEGETAAFIAKKAYGLADAMLEARDA